MPFSLASLLSDDAATEMITGSRGPAAAAPSRSSWSERVVGEAILSLETGSTSCSPCAAVRALEAESGAGARKRSEVVTSTFRWTQSQTI